jgi:DNA-binding MarR family transcriptional regulator
MGPKDKKEVQALLWALKPLANLRGSIPLPYVTTFLMVALDEGKGVGAYARALGMHRATASRYLNSIGNRNRNGSPGLGLVAVQTHPLHPHRRQVTLTAKGRSVADSVFGQMRKANGTS